MTLLPARHFCHLPNALCSDRLGFKRLLHRKAIALIFAIVVSAGCGKSNDPVRLLADAYKLEAKQEFSEAEVLYRKVISIQERTLGQEHSNTLATRILLGNVLRIEHKDAESEAEFRSILEIRERVLGPEHPDTLNARRRVAFILSKQGKRRKQNRNIEPSSR